MLGLVLALAIASECYALQSVDWLQDPRGEGFETVFPSVHAPESRWRRNLEPSNELDNGTDPKPLLIVVKGYNQTFYLELYPVNDISDRTIGRGEGETDCLYRGKVISEPRGVAAFSLCGGNDSMYGTWITPEGHFVLRPDTENGSGHRLRKLGNEPEQNGVSFCGTGEETRRSVNVNDERPIEIDPVRRSKRQVGGQKVIETAVFADVALNQKFTKKYKTQPLKQLTNYIMAVLNEVQLVYNFDSMKTRIKIVLVKLDVLKSGDAPGTGSGNIDKYLDSFCRWQSKKVKNGKGTWDHAIMLTGLNLFKMSGGKKSDKVLGQAWVNGMCIPIYSCTINEGDDFEAAYVIAHEMGHNLGMQHDGDKNNCDGNKFIMSPVTGAGKIQWSTCSNNQLVKFLQSDQVRSCLNNDVFPSSDLDFAKTGLPGQRYPPDKQCSMSMGVKYSAYMPNKSPYNNICYELWCITGMVATTTHPALDGSACGSGKVCRQGKCT